MAEQEEDFDENIDNADNAALVVRDGDDVGENDSLALVDTELKGLDPVERVTRAALRMADLTYERAFAIDNVNLGNKLGEFTISRLMEIFFDRIYKDQTDWFISLFSRAPKEDMVQYLADYMMQRLGGDPYYSANKGIPALILSHMHVDVSPRAAERWLDHFEEALDDVQDEVNPQQKDMIMDHMRYAAYFLVAAQVQQREDAAAGIHFLD